MSESASAITVLKELLNGKRIDIEQELRILENHRRILVGWKAFSGKTLGQLDCMNSGDGFYHELSMDDPSVVSGGGIFNLNSRGFYAGNSFSRKKNGERLAFGTDYESWLLIKASSSLSGKDLPPNYEGAKVVQVVRTDLPTILNEMSITPALIWDFLEGAANDWISEQKAHYDKACKVADEMREERLIFSYIT